MASRSLARSMALRSGAAIGLALLVPVAVMADEPVLEFEESGISVFPPLSPHWAFVTNWLTGGIRIIDGDTGKMVGMINSASLSDFAIDPAGEHFYVAETMWTRGNRGTRQDLLTIYDAKTLRITAEVELTGRLLVGNRPNNLSVSHDGKHAFVFNLDPATAIQVVDLAAQKMIGTIELPGCGLAMAGVGSTTVSLCADGSSGTVHYRVDMTGEIARSPVYFSAEKDPIFDNSFVDRRTGQAIFLSYSGMIYETILGRDSNAIKPWSLQAAAGLPKASIDPGIVNWLPGGRVPIAVNRNTGKAYIIMHMGEFWSQKEPGTELWELDLASRKVLRRKRLASPAMSVTITQDKSPLIFVLDDSNTLAVLDAATLEQRHSFANAGNGTISVTGN